MGFYSDYFNKDKQEKAKADIQARIETATSLTPEEEHSARYGGNIRLNNEFWDSKKNEENND